jgi:hypothetical protein
LPGETGGFKSLICPTAKAEYFFGEDWTGQISLKWFGKFDFARRPDGRDLRQSADGLRFRLDPSYALVLLRPIPVYPTLKRRRRLAT